LNDIESVTGQGFGECDESQLFWAAFCEHWIFPVIGCIVGNGTKRQALWDQFARLEASKHPRNEAIVAKSICSHNSQVPTSRHAIKAIIGNQHTQFRTVSCGHIPCLRSLAHHHHAVPCMSCGQPRVHRPPCLGHAAPSMTMKLPLLLLPNVSRAQAHLHAPSQQDHPRS